MSAAGDAGLTPLRWLLREQPALFVSLVYLFASGIGMLFSWRYLSHFGVDFFDYAQVGDFLLASLKEPSTWMLVVSLIVAMFFDNLMSRAWGAKERWRGTRWYGSERYRRLNNLVFVGLVLSFMIVFADLKARDTFDGELPFVDIKLAESGAQRRGILLATTSGYALVFDPLARQATAYPVEAIESLTLPGID